LFSEIHAEFVVKNKNRKIMRSMLELFSGRVFYRRNLCLKQSFWNLFRAQSRNLRPGAVQAKPLSA
jgi:hypothetical protein